MKFSEAIEICRITKIVVAYDYLGIRRPEIAHFHWHGEEEGAVAEGGYLHSTVTLDGCIALAIELGFPVSKVYRGWKEGRQWALDHGYARLPPDPNPTGRNASLITPELKQWIEANTSPIIWT